MKKDSHEYRCKKTNLSHFMNMFFKIFWNASREFCFSSLKKYLYDITTLSSKNLALKDLQKKNLKLYANFETIEKRQKKVLLLKGLSHEMD